MAERIVFELNGETRTIEVAPDTPLLYVLRNELGLSNPHFGCGLAQCGACTVHVDGAPTRSCSLPVSGAAGTKVTTLAGLGTPEHRYGVDNDDPIGREIAELRGGCRLG
jgi:aerobic-type carbon monoxide dehydrogenase small subunit (CoxS/CutS family)